MKVINWWKLSCDESFLVMKVKEVEITKEVIRSDGWWRFACGDVSSRLFSLKIWPLHQFHWSALLKQLGWQIELHRDTIHRALGYTSSDTVKEFTKFLQTCLIFLLGSPIDERRPLLYGRAQQVINIFHPVPVLDRNWVFQILDLEAFKLC